MFKVTCTTQGCTLTRRVPKHPRKDKEGKSFCPRCHGVLKVEEIKLETPKPKPKPEAPVSPAPTPPPKPPDSQ